MLLQILFLAPKRKTIFGYEHKEYRTPIERFSNISSWAMDIIHKYKQDTAKIFIEEISKAGIKSSEAPIKIIKIEKRIEFNDGKKTISIEPSKVSLDIDFELKYENQTSFFTNSYFFGNDIVNIIGFNINCSCNYIPIQRAN